MTSLLAIAAALFSSIAVAQDSETKIEDVAFKAKCDGSEQRYVLVLSGGCQDSNAHDVLIALHVHGSGCWQFVPDTIDECQAATICGRACDDLRLARLSCSHVVDRIRGEADAVQIICDLRRRPCSSRVF